MNEIEKRILLAGLLHDIGKFYQRADNKLFNGSVKSAENEIDQVSFNLAEQMCPPNESGGFGYHHVVWTSQFFESEKIKQILLRIPGLLNSNEPGKGMDDNLLNLSCNHHRPKTILQDIIRIGDCWSAGIDRNQPETFEKEEISGEPITWGRESYKKKPLASIFDFILPAGAPANISNKPCEPPSGKFNAFPLNALTIEDSKVFYPREITSKADGYSQELYRKLWNQFINEFALLPTDTFEGFFNSLLHLLRKFVWAIPSNTNDMAHVSLYDHLRLSAAFAHCIYRHYIAHPEKYESGANNRLIMKNDCNPVLLVGGDISGIQDFIYNIASSKAAVSLKGRSFYLQLLIETILLEIINHPDIQASNAHVVYASGGKFYMVLPNTNSVVEALDIIINKVEEELWEKHHGRISFLLSWVPFQYILRGENKGISIDSTPGKSVSDVWKKLADQLQIAKTTAFQTVICNNPEALFDEDNPDLHFDPEGAVCAVTGTLLKKGKTRLLDKDEDTGERVLVEEHVMHQADLGKVLKDVDYMITNLKTGQENSYLASRTKASIQILGFQHFLVDENELRRFYDEGLITSSDCTMVMRINNTNFLKTTEGKGIQYGFRYYGGNEQAYFRDENNQNILMRNESKWSKSFAELTRTKQFSEDSETYLGILRMDVDGLGDIFVNRIPHNCRTFSFYSTLSSMLDMFFSGYMNTIRNSEEYRDYINILYSGGDDLFVYGRWDKLIDFAYEVRKSFQNFTHRNDMSISGGLVIIHNKFPIKKAADMAHDAEQAAKKFNEGAKNAFTLFGETISWENEFDYVKTWKNRFVEVLIQPHTPKNLLHRIMGYAKRKKVQTDFKKRYPGEIPDYSYKWQAAYSIRRQMDKYENNQPVSELLKHLKLELFTQSSRNYDLLGIAARWAELELRIVN